MQNILIAVKEELSLAIIAGTAYPIIEISTPSAVLAASTESSAKSIARRVGGNLLATPTKEFPFEIHIDLSIFDRIIEIDRWIDIIPRIN